MSIIFHACPDTRNLTVLFFFSLCLSELLCLQQQVLHRELSVGEKVTAEGFVHNTTAIQRLYPVPVISNPVCHSNREAHTSSIWSSVGKPRWRTFQKLAGSDEAATDQICTLRLTSVISKRKEQAAFSLSPGSKFLSNWMKLNQLSSYARWLHSELEQNPEFPHP